MSSDQCPLSPLPTGAFLRLRPCSSWSATNTYTLRSRSEPRLDVSTRLARPPARLLAYRATEQTIDLCVRTENPAHKSPSVVHRYTHAPVSSGSFSLYTLDLDVLTLAGSPHLPPQVVCDASAKRCSSPRGQTIQTSSYRKPHDILNVRDALILNL